MLKRTGLAEQAAALEKADRENKTGDWIQLIGSLAQTAGYISGTPMGAAIGTGVKGLSDIFKESNTKSTYEAGGKER